MFNRAYYIITDKDDLTKENARIKQVLNENAYQEKIISKMFGELLAFTSCPSLEDTSQKLQRIIRSYNIRSNICTDSSVRELLCKMKDRVATEDKNDIVYEIDCSDCEAVYFFESKWTLKSRSDEH